MTRPAMTETDEIFRHEAFDEETKSLVCDAFNGAWVMLLTFGDSLADPKRHPDARANLARRIINKARMGERDITALRMDAMRYLRETSAPWP